MSLPDHFLSVFITLSLVFFYRRFSCVQRTFKIYLRQARCSKNRQGRQMALPNYRFVPLTAYPRRQCIAG